MSNTLGALSKLTTIVAFGLLISLFQLASPKDLSAEELRPFQVEAIINGQSSMTGSWPWMTTIHLNGRTPAVSHFCGGMLVASRFVLTAAHCMVDYVVSPEKLAVVVGRTTLTSLTGESRLVSTIVIHPKYSKNTNENDLALLKLSSAITTIAPLDLIEADELGYWSDGAAATILGWGTLDTVETVRPNQLQEAIIPVVSDARCSERLGLDFAASSMLCGGILSTTTAPLNGVDSCYGDSGGPVVVQTPAGWKLIGISSWGYSCASTRFWGVYTRVDSFREWIRSLPAAVPFAIKRPSVRGVARAGSTLSCVLGQWGGNESENNFSVVWNRADRGPITGAVGLNYKVSLDDIGKKISCQVTVTYSNGQVTANSKPFGPIIPKLKKVGSKSSLVSASRTICASNHCQLFVELTDLNVMSLNANIVRKSANKSTRSLRSNITARGQKISAKIWALNFRGKKGDNFGVKLSSIDSHGHKRTAKF